MSPARRVAHLIPSLSVERTAFTSSTVTPAAVGAVSHPSRPVSRHRLASVGDSRAERDHRLHVGTAFRECIVGVGLAVMLSQCHEVAQCSPFQLLLWRGCVSIDALHRRRASDAMSDRLVSK